MQFTAKCIKLLGGKAQKPSKVIARNDVKHEVYSLQMGSLNQRRGLRYISLLSLYDYVLKMPNFSFNVGRELKTTNFLFFSCHHSVIEKWN